MTIPRLKEITQYQNSNPPLHMMIAAYFGIGNKDGSNTQSGTDDQDNSLFDVLPMG